MNKARTPAFFAIALLLCSWHLDRGHNANTVSRAAMVAAIVEHGTLRIDPYHGLTGDKALIDGHYYSDKAPLPALLVTPVYWTLVRLGLMGPGEHGLMTEGLLMLGGFLCGSVPLAVIITLCWLRVRRRAPTFSPALLATLPFLGSFLFVYSGSFNAHLIGALFLLLALQALERERLVAAGLMSGAAVLCEYPLVVFPACWALWLLAKARFRREGARHLLRFTLGGTPFILLMLAYNALLTGDPLSVGYEHEANYTFMGEGYGMARPTLASLWGLTFSAYRGLFTYMPVMLLAVPVLAWAAWKGKGARHVEVWLPCLLSLLLIASYRMWWGGWAIGPRHLSAAAVLLAFVALPMVGGLRWTRVPSLVLGTAGIAISFAAKSTVWYSLPTEVKAPLREILLPKVLEGDWTTMQLPVLFGIGPGASTIAFLFITLAALFLLTRMDVRTPVPSA